MASYTLHLDTPFATTLLRMLERLDASIPNGVIVRVIIAGGIAVNLYTGMRATVDIDAEFSHKVVLPSGEDGLNFDPPLFWDKSYNPSFSLLHEDYQEDTISVGIDFPHLDVRVLSPVDLAVSKIARLADIDRQDIVALVQAGLVSSDDLERRAREAAIGWLGWLNMLNLNIQDAVELARSVERDRKFDPPPLSV